MTVGTLLARNHNVLAKACLGGGFSFGFLYTNKTGTSPIRTLASRAGTCITSQKRFRISRVYLRPIQMQPNSTIATPTRHRVLPVDAFADTLYARKKTPFQPTLTFFSRCHSISSAPHKQASKTTSSTPPLRFAPGIPTQGDAEVYGHTALRRNSRREDRATRTREHHPRWKNVFPLVAFFPPRQQIGGEEKTNAKTRKKRPCALHCKMNVVLIELSFCTVKENVVLIELKPKKGGLHERVVTCIVVLKDH
jgi:hypothetical protein